MVAKVNARVELPMERIAAFCQKYGVAEFSLFGSVLRDDFGPDSDVDVLVEFEPGHIPGACNLPFGALYNEDGTFRSRDEMRRLFAAADVDPFEPFTASCGSGVTAISLIFAAHLLGNDSTKLYDGSWSEWGSDPDTPKALGPA